MMKELEPFRLPPFEPLTLELDILWEPELGDGIVVVSVRHKVIGHTVATLTYTPERALALAETLREQVHRIEEYRSEHGI